MFKKMGGWFKGHRMFRVLLPSAMVLVLVSAFFMPYASAVEESEYLDVTGAYEISKTIPAKYLDGSKHPNIPLGTLAITTQTVGTGAITLATLTMPWGADIDLDGLVGPGGRPYISLAGTDDVGTYVAINGRVSRKGETVTGITGKIEGYITSDGEKGTDYDSTGTAVHYVGANSYGGSGYSALLTAGVEDQSSVLIQFNNPSIRLKVRDLSRLSSGLSFYYKFENLAVCGPQIELRFVAPTCTDPGGAGHVDITVHPLESAEGDGEWKLLTITSASTPVTYFGNAPVSGTGFYKIGTAGPLSGTLALIDAENAMKLQSASAANWTLQRVRIELWDDMSDDERTCYIDDVRIGHTTYTLEPVKFSGTFKAKKQALD